MVGQSHSVEMIDKETNPRIIEALDDIALTNESRVGQEQVKRNENVNQSKNGTTPTVLKVYEWFDEANNSESPSLTGLQVNEKVKQGKVAVRQSDAEDREELTEELLNGPRRDARESGHTNVRLLKKLCVPRDDSVLSDGPSGPKQDVKAVGTTDCIRGGLCLKDRGNIIKQIKAS